MLTNSLIGPDVSRKQQREEQRKKDQGSFTKPVIEQAKWNPAMRRKEDEISGPLTGFILIGEEESAQAPSSGADRCLWTVELT